VIEIFLSGRTFFDFSEGTPARTGERCIMANILFLALSWLMPWLLHPIRRRRVKWVEGMQTLCPSVVVFVKTHCNGKANETHFNHVRDLRRVWEVAGFLTAVLCADSDISYAAFINPIYRNFREGKVKNMSFQEIVYGTLFSNIGAR
jgi:hypothetical protein